MRFLKRLRAPKSLKTISKRIDLGSYVCGFYHLLGGPSAEGDEEQEKHWHKLEYMSNIINDYTTMYMKRSDIAYKCTQDIKGYIVTYKDW